MYLAEITFPSGFYFTVKIHSLSTACYWAREFSCNVLVFISLEDQIMIKTKPGTCGAVAKICECIHDKGHNGPHECNCTGAWRGNYNDESFEVISFPNPFISPEYKNN